MAVTPLCTTTEVEAILSQFGLESCLDDDKDGAADPTLSDAVIEKARRTSGNSCLCDMPLQISPASAWVKWVTATYCGAQCLQTTRQPGPESLVEQATAYLEQLKLIRDGWNRLSVMPARWRRDSATCRR
jgi:hypothetical protein